VDGGALGIGDVREPVEDVVVADVVVFRSELARKVSVRVVAVARFARVGVGDGCPASCAPLNPTYRLDSEFGRVFDVR